MAETSQAQIEGLATLLVLDDEIKRLANIREFGFFSTNETHRLIAYHTAYLWEKKDLRGPILIAQSGTAELDIHATTNQWLKEKILAILNSPNAKQMYQYNAIELEPNLPSDPKIWPESLPHYLLWCPFVDKTNQVSGGLVFFREQTFSESEIKMLRWLIASFQYTWNLLIKPTSLTQWDTFKKKPYFIASILIIAAILLFPIHLSVLGSATVVPENPVMINAPIQGVIQAFAVSPGAAVNKGELLVRMDPTDLMATAEVNQRDYSLTQAKLRTSINEAFNDNSKRTEVPVLQAQLAIDRARLDYTNELLKKTQIKSPIQGIVIFDSKEDWVGQPVQTGEKVLVVANPNQVKLRISVPVTDIIKIKKGATGLFFLYGRLTALSVSVNSLGYNAKMMPNKILSYQLEAKFNDNTDLPQIGAQGTVKLYGDKVPLIYYFLRRPLEAFRHKLGI